MIRVLCLGSPKHEPKFMSKPTMREPLRSTHTLRYKLGWGSGWNLDEAYVSLDGRVLVKLSQVEDDITEPVVEYRHYYRGTRFAFAGQTWIAETLNKASFEVLVLLDSPVKFLAWSPACDLPEITPGSRQYHPNLWHLSDHNGLDWADCQDNGLDTAPVFAFPGDTGSPVFKTQIEGIKFYDSSYLGLMVHTQGGFVKVENRILGYCDSHDRWELADNLQEYESLRNSIVMSCLDLSTYECDSCGTTYINEGYYDSFNHDPYVCDSCYNEREEEQHDRDLDDPDEWIDNVLSYGTNVLDYRSQSDKAAHYGRLGCEIELLIPAEHRGEAQERVERLYNDIRSKCILKSDASLDGLLYEHVGVELVTAPLTIEDLLEKVAPVFGHDRGFSDGAGLHIHSSKDHWSDRQIEIVAAFMGGLTDSESEDLWGRMPTQHCVKHSYNFHRMRSGERYTDEYRSRYHCLNLQNGNTIEFRCFSSPQTLNEFQLRLETVAAMHLATLLDPCIDNADLFVSTITGLPLYPLAARLFSEVFQE